MEETAEVMSNSPATVKRAWSSARAFLHSESHEQAGTDPELCDDVDCPHYPPCSCFGTLIHVAVSPAEFQPKCFCECHERNWNDV